MAFSGEYSKPGYILRNGIPLTQPGTISVKTTSNDKDVETLLLGLAGFSDGAQSVEISVKSAIPIEGFEYDATAICLNHQTQDLAFRIAGAILTVRGRIMSTSVETAVNAANGLDFDFKGRVVSRIAA